MSGGNPFIRGIVDGSIGSVEELKAAFRAEAKRAHPDLSDGGGGHDAFLKLRADYERALRELGRGAERPAAAETRADAAAGAVPADAPGALDGLLKRGFPKRPRHKKEALRYGAARVRAGSGLRARDESLPALLDAMERELLDGPPAHAEAVLSFLRAWIAAESSGVAAAAAAAAMELGKLFPPTPLGAGGPDAAAPGTVGEIGRPGPASEAFCRALTAGRTARGWK